MSKAIKFRNKNNEPIYPCPYFPVGSIYITVENTNPSIWFGGTWVSFGAGRCLVGVDTSQTEFSTVQKTGGEKTHKLTVSEMPSHTHPIKSGYGDMDSTSYDSYRYQYWGHNSNSWKSGDLGAGSTGGNQAHNNMPPYITVYMWRRTK